MYTFLYIFTRKKTRSSKLYINVNWEDTQTRRLWMFQKCSTLEDTFLGEVNNPQLAQTMNQKECGMLSVLFNLLSLFFFLVFWVGDYFFSSSCAPRSTRKNLKKKKCFFFGFSVDKFFGQFSGKKEIVFWINLLWQYIWLRLGCRYCTVLTEASLLFWEIFILKMVNYFDLCRTSHTVSTRFFRLWKFHRVHPNNFF